MAFGGYLQANTAVDVMVGPFVDETAGAAAAGEIADAVWDESDSDHLAAGSKGQRLHHSGGGRYG